jgi:hypothetical protein
VQDIEDGVSEIIDRAEVRAGPPAPHLHTRRRIREVRVVVDAIPGEGDDPIRGRRDRPDRYDREVPGGVRAGFDPPGDTGGVEELRDAGQEVRSVPHADLLARSLDGMRWTRTLAAVALATSGCGGTGGATEVACDDFAAFIRDGRPIDQRVDVIRGIGDIIGNADPRVRDAHDTLVATVDGSPGAQALADDTFAQACYDTGWDG